MGRSLGRRRPGEGCARDVESAARPKVALNLTTEAGSVRMVFLLLLGLAAALCVVVLVSGHFFRLEPRNSSQNSVSQPTPVSSPVVSTSQNETPRPASRVASPENPDTPGISIVSDRPRFAAADLPVPRKTAETDQQLQIASASLRDYRSAFHENPVGSNAEITQRLLGKNPRSVRYLPANAHINNASELTDRWDQPVFFHQISGTLMEIRSAGPDHVMWTGDDEVLR
jgi:hypothetical protein